MSIVIAQLKNQKDAGSVASYIHKFRGKVRIMEEDELENQWMIKMIDEAEMEGGEVPEVEIIKTLKQNGAKIQTKVQA